MPTIFVIGKTGSYTCFNAYNLSGNAFKFCAGHISVTRRTIKWSVDYGRFGNEDGIFQSAPPDNIFGKSTVRDYLMIRHLKLENGSSFQQFLTNIQNNQQKA